MKGTFDNLRNQWFSHIAPVVGVCLEPSQVDNLRLKRYNQDCTISLPIGCVSLALLAY